MRRSDMRGWVSRKGLYNKIVEEGRTRYLVSPLAAASWSWQWCVEPGTE